MRVLFATTAGSGHFGPLIPLAKACSDAGCEVKVAAPASFAAAVAGAGMDHAPFADAPQNVIGAVFARLPELSFEEANETVVAEVFGRLDARAALTGVSEMIDAWRPDIVVREPCEFASLVAAERAGVPQVQVAIGMGGMVGFALGILAAPLAELSVLAGLAEEQAVATMLSVSEFTCVPAVLDDVTERALSGEATATGPRWRFRDPSLLAVAGSLPSPWGDPARPLVYVTFGSVTAGLGSFSGLYSSILDALADMPIRVLLTTGAECDPAGLEPWPANAHVERWWPQAEVMAHADVVVGHGGFGTTMTALATGVPQVVVPLFAFDQTINAERVAAAGAGIHVPGGPAAVADIPAALARALSDRDYRDAARAVAVEIAELPEVAASVPILEQLAAC